MRIAGLSPLWLLFNVASIAAQQPRIARLPETPASLPVVKAVGFRSGSSLPIPGSHRTGTVGGQEAVGWVELSAPAPCTTGCGTYVNGRPAGGMLVHVVSGNPSVAAVQPHTGLVLVPVGQTRQRFTVLTSGVSAPTAVVISAARDGSPAQNTRLEIYPPNFTGFGIDQSSVLGGYAVHGTLRFNGTAATAGAITVAVSSNSPSVRVPATVALEVHKTAATFDIGTSGVATATPAVISAAYGGVTFTATLTVQPALLAKYDRDGVHLTGPAPAAGALIRLQSANPSVVTVPQTLTVRAGSTEVTVQYDKHMDYAQHAVTVTATYAGVSKSYSVHVYPLVKADLAIREVTVRDRFGNTVARPQDGQAYQLCVTPEFRNTRAPGYQWVTSTAVHISYLTPTGTGTSTGHESVLTIAFPISMQYGSYYFGSGTHWNSDMTTAWFDPTCTTMPGLSQPGDYTDVDLMIDPQNAVDESNEGNNRRHLRITRQ